MSIHKYYLYSLSFLEGGAVMACELIGARILAPYFGTSLYVWAAALGITLGGLMMGYFAGGILSRRVANNVKLLYWILFSAGCTLMLMPLSSHWIMEHTLSLPFQLGVIISLLIFMFPPLVLLGITSPIVINILTNSPQSAGNMAGNVYGISTLGGILITFLLGFYLIPEFGISHPALVIGLLLAIPPAISLLQIKVRSAPILLLAIACLAAAFQPENKQTSKHETLRYQSEGILGQIKIIDFSPFAHEPERILRGLVVNNTLQTVMDLNAPETDFWKYTKIISECTKRYPPGSRVLLLGMGGGTLAKHLCDRGYQVEAVEIDARLEHIAKQFFQLPASTRVWLDDARHFIRTNTGQYNIIIYDVFKGESAPEHILTKESLLETADNLKQDGLLLVNFYGYWEGPNGRLSRAVFKTMLEAGYYAQVLASPGTAAERNLIFVAGTSNTLPLETLQEARIKTTPLDTLHAETLTDDHPQLGLYAQSSSQWRQFYNNIYTQQLSRSNTNK
ncbi:MAG: fused MFS/spermidine synthase [Lewinellaceae bacterium]|nr:fused MFS/spermidine synthase [Lewinellaceae bacterium]